MSAIKRPRGRPRNFDPDEAMEKISELFRAKGYAATSLDEISQVTGLTRPSLYSAFGDKLSIYLKALEHFGKKVIRTLEPIFRGQSNIEKVLTQFYQAMLDIYSSGDAAGCLTFGTAPCAAYEEPIREKLIESSSLLDSLLVDALAARSSTKNPDKIKAAAEMAANTLMALSVRAKAGVPENELLAMCKRSSKAIAELLDP